MSRPDPWFETLRRRLGDDAPPPPTREEVAALLDMGKDAAAAGPQRFYAMLTAYWAGRAVERGGPALLRAVAQAVRAELDGTKEDA